MSANVAILALVIVVCGVMAVWLRPRREDGTGPARAPDDAAPGGVAVQLERPWKLPIAPGPPPALPPDPLRAWTSEIEWHQSESGARFRVVCGAPGTGGAAISVAESPPLAWPPTSPASVQALTAAADRLERSLVAAGWTPLPPGSAWYAKRFAWQSAAPAPGDIDEEEVLDLFGPAPAWPTQAEGLWRCEIRWDAGWAESRFQAVAYRPRGRRGRPIAASSGLKWLLMGPPDPREREHRDAVHGLASELEATGWEPAGRGPSWYSRRFSWPRDGAPSRDVLVVSRRVCPIRRKPDDLQATGNPYRPSVPKVRQLVG